jgi:hypothetical protein
MAKKSLATYYRSGGFRKVYACQPGEESGTVDLLDPEGEVLVRGCPVIEDPDSVEPRELPDGYSVIEGPAPKKKAAAKKAAAKKTAAKGGESDPEPEGDEGDDPENDSEGESNSDEAAPQI